MNPVEVLEKAAAEAAADLACAITDLAHAEAKFSSAQAKLMRLDAACRALKGEAPLPTATSGTPEKSAAPPPKPEAPKGALCMACEAYQVFPVQREMRGTVITVNTCQACGCDNLL